MTVDKLATGSCSKVCVALNSRYVVENHTVIEYQPTVSYLSGNSIWR